MLQNEKYAGDVLLQKTYTADFLEKKVKKNRGEVKQYYITRGLPTSEVLFQLQSHEIKKIAQQESCIFVGRCADFVLREEDVKIVKVFVREPVEWRIKRKMQQEHLSHEKAAHLVHKMDKRRKKYYESYTGQIWGDPRYYDFCIDTGVTDFEEAVTTICSLYNSL